MREYYADLLAYEINVPLKILKSKWTRTPSSKKYREGMLFVSETIATQNLELWL